MVRLTGRRVRLGDQCARSVITFGGIVVLAAMFGILVFLIMSAAPLFVGAKVVAVGPSASLALGGEPAFLRLINGADRALIITTEAELVEARLTDGRVARRIGLIDEGSATSIAFEPGRWRATIGTGDGRVYTAVVDEQWFSLPESAAALLPSMQPGDIVLLDDEAVRERISSAARVNRTLSSFSSVEMLPSGARTLWEPTVERGAVFTIRHGDGAIVCIDSGGVGEQSRYLGLVREDGSALFGTIRSTVRLDGGGRVERLVEYPIDLGEIDSLPRWFFVFSDGTGVLALWENGMFLRFDARDLRSGVRRVEKGRVVSEDETVTAASMALGGLTLIVGGSSGKASAWLVSERVDSTSADGRMLTQRWRDSVGDGAVQSISPGDRDRSVVFVGASGSVLIKHVTSLKRLAEFAIEGPAPRIASTTPSSNRVLWLRDDGSFESRELDPGYPSVSVASLFGKVHYEGYSDAQWVYQSTGDVQSEPKYSLIPLIFGTLKATVFAMFFAIPLGVLSAIYASEFMNRKMHRVVKPGIELMASLPSVVIGFVAAMVVAPFVRQWLPSIMVGMFVIPTIAILGGMIWQTLPTRWSRRFGSRTKLSIVLGILAVGLVASSLAGPVVQNWLFSPSRAERLVAAGSYETIPEAEARWSERRVASLTVGERAQLRRHGVFFVDGRAVKPLESDDSLPAVEGSIEKWLDGNFGGAWSGWFVVMMIPACIAVMGLHTVFVAKRWTGVLERKSRAVAASLEVGRFVSSVGAIVACAGVFAWGLSAAGLDPRESIFGQFTPRNTLIVGLVMGFAIIPIIFTISEDALASVPKSLRSASLGSGATPWQTAIRVVLPVAGSGIFSACMIGLGRAVGETMIVLMATGNTPEMSWNMFSGFRTLAANIAVELPEAPKGGTHYRVLFVCGLILFLMTLMINTTAEFVRQHFRKKSAAL